MQFETADAVAGPLPGRRRQCGHAGESGASGGKGCRIHVCLGIEWLLSFQGGWEVQEVAPGRGEGGTGEKGGQGATFDQRGFGEWLSTEEQGLSSLKNETESEDGKK